MPVVPPELARYANDWPVPQGNLAATRSAVNSVISSSNVTRLGVAWTFDLPVQGIYGSVTANPIVAGDTVYIQDMQSNVFALDRATGSLKWRADFSVGSAGPNGVSIGYSQVFATLGDEGMVVALDQVTGEEIWRTQIATPPGEGIDMAPIANGGLVYVSTVPGTSEGMYVGHGNRGRLYALSAIDGEVAWSFDTTNNGWGAPALATGGGLWYPPSFDAAGNVYFGVGNPGPYPLTPDCPNGSCRPGDNEFTDSMVSLDARSGTLRWFYQDRKHDLLDLDFQNTPVLTSLHETPIAIGSGKTGTVVAVDASSGGVLWRTSVCVHKNDDVENLPSDSYLEILPGLFGGIETPIAYSNGVAFVTCVNVPQYQSATGAGPNNGAFASGTSSVVAINVSDGSVKWEQKVPTVLLGGVTVANDVIFTSGLDGFLRSYDAELGTELWAHESRSGYNAPSAVAGDMVFAAAGFLKFPQGGGPPVDAAPDGSSAPVPRLTAFILSKD